MLNSSPMTESLILRAVIVTESGIKIIPNQLKLDSVISSFGVAIHGAGNNGIVFSGIRYIRETLNKSVKYE